MEKHVENFHDKERTPTEDDSSHGDDVDLGSFPLFSVDKLSSIGDPVPHMTKVGRKRGFSLIIFI